ncbi:serine/threonine protein kinase [Lujinxingia vulgaris]|uniref:Serine/threonine protein kinase n=2 Tax=Lujinxingia vulgaris TaxID=2600176 RepID=A0A5C6X7Q6_9DELT|nr:serine/threonine protein kinase [Lujinxingia vulgaris]
MGVVYLATDTRLNRQVAQKMLSEALRENPEARRLFLEEARAMATLTHPNLVAVHDVTSFDDRDVIITELVRGKNLDEILEANGPLELDRALEVGFQLANAVAFLHEQGIIHRDLKPANAILEPEGKLKLIDFGLARSVDHLMARGTAVRGTPAYMAPEQILGPQITDKTDVYQLGVTLYELLCKELPFEMTGSGLLAHINKPAIELCTRRAGIPDEFQRLVHRCILPEPDQRPTAAELAAELSSFCKTYCGHTLATPLGHRTRQRRDGRSLNKLRNLYDLPALFHSGTTRRPHSLHTRPPRRLQRPDRRPARAPEPALTHPHPGGPGRGHHHRAERGRLPHRPRLRHHLRARSHERSRRRFGRPG